MSFVKVAFAATVMAIAGPDTGSAQTTSRDVEVAARAVAFLAAKPSGEQSTAIVYDPSNPESQADADALAAILSGGVSAKGVSLGAPRLVAISDVSGLSGVQVVFITKGVNAAHADIARAAAQHGMLTVSSDLECARAGHCVVGVQGQPSVEILISKQASEATGKEFSAAFLMMAKEI